MPIPNLLRNPSRAAGVAPKGYAVTGDRPPDRGFEASNITEIPN